MILQKSLNGKLFKFFKSKKKLKKHFKIFLIQILSDKAEKQLVDTN